MDTGDGDDTATMEVDGDAVEMETNGPGEGMAEHGAENSGEVVDGSQMEQQRQSQVWCLPEGLCSKRIICKGEGLVSPVMGAGCLVNLHALENQMQFDATIIGYPLGESSIQLDEGDTPIARMIDYALLSMKRGETSELLLQVQEQKEIRLLLVLIDFTTAVPYWHMTKVQKRTTAIRHKEQGAQLFKEGRVEAAFRRFQLATHLLLSVAPQELAEDDETTIDTHQTLLCQCYLNLAACQMKTGHHQHVIVNCTCALQLDPTSVKACYRRASAYMGVGDLDLARIDLEKGLSKEPCNQVLQELLQSVNARLAQSNIQMAQGLSKMFS